ncbi:hypothetical protein V1290_000086 [Bradyrhizobium sp. AZCC 1578]
MKYDFELGGLTVGIICGFMLGFCTFGLLH